MNMIQKRLRNFSKWDGNLTLYIKGRILRNGDKSRRFIVYFTGMMEYEVKGHTRTWTVDLDSKVCDCREWKISETLCLHPVIYVYNIMW